MAVFVHVDDILAHAQVTTERFTDELGIFYKWSRWWRSSASRRQAGHQLFRGCQPSLQVGEPQTREEEEMLKLPYREAVGALMWTATMIRPDSACAVRAVARFWKPWSGALLKYGDVLIGQT